MFDVSAERWGAHAQAGRVATSSAHNPKGLSFLHLFKFELVFYHALRDGSRGDWARVTPFPVSMPIVAETVCYLLARCAGVLRTVLYLLLFYFPARDQIRVPPAIVAQW